MNKELQKLQAGMDQLLANIAWREIKSDRDMPDREVTCLIWLKGAEHPTLATCNVDARTVKYFILANSGTAKRAMDEVTHWKPVGPGPHG